jgi:hypothetical protein
VLRDGAQPTVPRRLKPQKNWDHMHVGFAFCLLQQLKFQGHCNNPAVRTSATQERSDFFVHDIYFICTRHTHR